MDGREVRLFWRHTAVGWIVERQNEANKESELLGVEFKRVQKPSNGLLRTILAEESYSSSTRSHLEK